MARAETASVSTCCFLYPWATGQDKKKGGTPDAGQSQFAPGQKQTDPGTAKPFAPGQKQTDPGTAKKFAPGQQDPPKK